MKKSVMIGIVVFWLIIIFGFIGYKEYTLVTGEEVVLRTVPVDPRDLFRGDYVILSYDISRVDVTESNQGVFQEGDDVYVGLTIKNGFGEVDYVYDYPPEGLFIKGQVQRASDARLVVEYGIESYFVPEGEGIPLQNQITDAVVSIDDFGNAVIKYVTIDGKKVELDKLSQADN